MGVILYLLAGLLGFLASMIAVLVFKVGFGFGVILYFLVAFLTPGLLILLSAISRRLNLTSKFYDRIDL